MGQKVDADIACFLAPLTVTYDSYGRQLHYHLTICLYDINIVSWGEASHKVTTVVLRSS